MRVRDTIVAVASPPGSGVRALVRVSGEGARAAARVILGIASPARGVVRARAALAGKARCPVLAMWMDRGASFTGEDVLEISCVGSPALADALVAALIEGVRSEGLDARHAQAGEFSYRAFMSGRLTSDEAEAIAARIAATGDAELAAADELERGRTGERIASLVARVAELLALVEAGIDFTDQEDVVAIAPDPLARRADELAGECAELRGANASARAHAVPLVVLAGAPNAGKSTLFNALLGRPRSVASALAGTTRDAIVERVALGRGLVADLADLAGLDSDPRGASPAIHAAMQRRAGEMLSAADIVVRCTERGAVPVGLAVTAEIIDVTTKADISGSAAHESGGTLAVSARTGEGVESLRAGIAKRIARDHALRRAQLATVLPRHDAAFAAASEGLSQAANHARACTASGRLADVEIIASLLRSALDSLGEIAGPVHPDDVLGLIFSRFCVGK